jgi:hypothetical protein
MSRVNSLKILFSKCIRCGYYSLHNLTDYIGFSLFSISLFFWSSLHFGFDPRVLFGIVPLLCFSRHLRKKINLNWCIVIFVALIFHTLLTNILYFGGHTDNVFITYVKNPWILLTKNDLVYSYFFLCFLIYFYIFRDKFEIFIIKSIKIFLPLIFFIQLTILLASLKFPHIKGLHIDGRVAGLFSEPSHFAMSIAPIWAAFILNFGKFRSNFNILYIFILTISTLLCLSATLVISILFLLCLKFFLICIQLKLSKKKYEFYFVFLAIISAFFLMIFMSEGLMSRLDSLFEILRHPDAPKASLNVSTVTLINHFLSSVHSLIQFNWIGAGFNHYERAFADFYPISIFRDILWYKELGYLNFNDGSANFNKLLSEFGILFLLSSFYLGRGFISALNSRDFLLHFLVGTFITLTFIRSAGYFNAGYLFSIFIFLKLGLKKF